MKPLTLYRIKKDGLLLSPKSGQPLKNNTAIAKALESLGCAKIRLKSGRTRWVVTYPDLRRWNNAVKVIHGEK